NAAETVVVGDTAYDILMGQSAGTHTCAVTYGNGTAAQLATADYVINDFADLAKIL
ncbi:MAG: HAD hydrolase-like protein, partial [Bacteroidales bacterium]|nr:HAD hydrolase-like protein [Bacteroidales bacterium]